MRVDSTVSGRLFIGARIPDDVRALLDAKLRDGFGVDGVPGRPIPPANWHFTLRFIGDVEALTGARIASALENADLGKCFGIELGRLGAFPTTRNARVLWVGLKRGIAEMAGLAKRVNTVLTESGLEPESRAYIPHLTIGRCRIPADLRDALAPVPEMKIDAAIDRVVLFRSHLGSGSPRYESLMEVPLG